VDVVGEAVPEDDRTAIGGASFKGRSACGAKKTATVMVYFSGRLLASTQCHLA
jgi:hypothetical protein